MDSETKQVGIYLPIPYYNTIEDLCSKTGQTFNGFVKGLISDYLITKGLINGKEDLK